MNDPLLHSFNGPGAIVSREHLQIDHSLTPYSYASGHSQELSRALTRITDRFIEER